MRFPSDDGGPTTQEVGYIRALPECVASWLRKGLDDDWDLVDPDWQTGEEAISALKPSVPLSRYACVPVDDWTLILSNGPMGTDVGVLPSQAARELRARAIRAVCVADDSPAFAARILEVYGPHGQPPMAIERSIVAADDGGRWVFETSGAPYEFEHVDAYRRRIKSQRFTCDMLHSYLRALEVPVDAEPTWSGTILVEHKV